MEPRKNAERAEQGTSRPLARTLLEQLIKDERGETFEEFAAYAEEFARRHGLPGTLSLRHLLRLVAGRKPDGSPLGQPRPATAKLLEQIFGLSIVELLAPPRTELDDEAAELRQRMLVARQVDRRIVELFREQLTALRRLDRQMGALVAYNEVRQKAEQVSQLHMYSLTPNVRSELAQLMADLNSLAGWEALDRCEMRKSWDHHELAKRAALDADASALLVYAAAQQALILTEVGKAQAAVDQLDGVRALAKKRAPALVRSWLAAAHGEGLAAAGYSDQSMHAFDEADALLPADPKDPALPFLFLERVHLDRWRGNALARIGDIKAIDVLTGSLDRLDPSFVRAEAALHVDLAIILDSTDRGFAQSHAERATCLADQVGSVRQSRRVRQIRKSDSCDD